MSTIGKLPQLEVLKLGWEAFKGEKWDLEDGEFSNLRFLRLFALDVEQINDIASDPFPCLEELVVIYCELLKKIPSSFGDICTLKTITVVSSDKAACSARRILKQQREMGNYSLKVFIKKGMESETYKLDDEEEEAGLDGTDDDNDAGDDGGSGEDDGGDDVYSYDSDFGNKYHGGQENEGYDSSDDDHNDDDDDYEGKEAEEDSWEVAIEKLGFRDLNSGQA